jgi:tRNA (mo5U34)-methyltransferase
MNASSIRTLQSAGAQNGPLGAQINALAPWFHNLHLPDGTQTAPDHPLGDFPRFKWDTLGALLPDDLTGWQALDIGCNAGFYSLELARRGASVLAVDHDEHYLRQLLWARDRFGYGGRVRCRRLDVYGIKALPRFDLVLFLGVFYHLRYPLLGLDRAASRASRLFVFQSLSLPGDTAVEDTRGRTYEEINALGAPGWPRMAFIEHDFAGDPTNWWIPNPAASQALLRSAGLRILSCTADGSYVCAPGNGNEDRLQ